MTLDVFRIGFLPLVDAALPILARELGFAEEQGVDLQLMRDVSWATVRDRLLYGHSDAAHLVDPESVESIATAMVTLHGDPRRRTALRERGLARSRQFSWDRTARQTIQVYAELHHRNTTR